VPPAMPALPTTDDWMAPSPKPFGAPPTEARQAVSKSGQQASSSSWSPSTAGGADAGAGGMTVPHSVPKRGIPATSKAPQRVPPPARAFRDPINEMHENQMFADQQQDHSWSDNSWCNEPASSSTGGPSWDDGGTSWDDQGSSWNLLDNHQDSGAGGLPPPFFRFRSRRSTTT
jgi:hypothetical protein